MAEPATITAVVTALANLGSSYLSGKKLEDLFKDQRGEIASLIDQAVQRIERFISASFEEERIRSAQAKINSCLQNLVEWERLSNSQGSNKTSDGQLEYALTDSEEAIQMIDDSGWQRIEVLGDAVSVRILALCANAKRTHNKGAIANLRSYADIRSRQLSSFFDEGKAHLTALVNGVTPISITDRRSHIERGIPRGEAPDVTVGHSCKAYFHDNGQEHNVIDVFGGTAQEAAEAATHSLSIVRNEILGRRQQLLNDWTDQVGELVRIRHDAWKDAVEKAEKLT